MNVESIPVKQLWAFLSWLPKFLPLLCLPLFLSGCDLMYYHQQAEREAAQKKQYAQISAMEKRAQMRQIAAHQALVKRIHAAGYQNYYQDGIWNFVKVVTTQGFPTGKSLILLSHVDDGFVLTQIMGNKLIFEPNEQLLGMIPMTTLVLPKEPGHQYAQGQNLYAAYSGAIYFAFVKTVELQNVLGAHISALYLRPVRL